MKFIVSKQKAINLNNVDDFHISSGYLKITTGGGLDAREVQFVYGTNDELTKLFYAILQFINDDNKRIFDCDQFIESVQANR